MSKTLVLCFLVDRKPPIGTSGCVEDELAKCGVVQAYRTIMIRWDVKNRMQVVYRLVYVVDRSGHETTQRKTIEWRSKNSDG
jgi:hypothetical protein